MGYTHYYERRRDVAAPTDAYGRWAMDAKAIIAAAEGHGIRIAGWDGGREAAWPEFTEGYVSLNGWGDESCETFIWHAEVQDNPEWVRPDQPYCYFVKTRQRPYDAVVVALLLRLKHYYGDAVDISSDGSWEEYKYSFDGESFVDPGWTLGRALYREVFGEDAPCPWQNEPWESMA
jgi:hypothetical protein